MHFTVYSMDNCNFCTKAKALLDMKDYDYTELKLDQDLTRDAILEAMAFYGHGRTMPMVIKEDEHGNKELVGGYTELNQLLGE